LGAQATFLGAQIKFSVVNPGGGGVGEFEEDGGVNCGNFGEGSWGRDFS